MKHVTYMAVIAMLLLSCNTSEEKPVVQDVTPDSAATSGYLNKAEDEDRIAAPGAPQVGTAKFTPPQIIRDDWEKKIIKTAEVTLELKDYSQYNQKLHAGLKAYGAYVASEEQTSSPERIANQLVIKVPVAQFDDLVNSFSGEGITLLQKKISAEDVTEEVVDTKARMASKKQVRDRYLELLKQARNMKEVLEVQQEINSIQEEIESAEGRVGYLSHQSAYSTIHLNYFEYLNGATPQQSPGFLLRITDGFRTGITAMGNLLVLLATIWPLWVAVLVALVWMRRKKQAADKPAV